MFYLILNDPVSACVYRSYGRPFLEFSEQGMLLESTLRLGKRMHKWNVAT